MCYQYIGNYIYKSLHVICLGTNLFTIFALEHFEN